MWRAEIHTIFNERLPICMPEFSITPHILGFWKNYRTCAGYLQAERALIVQANVRRSKSILNQVNARLALYFKLPGGKER